ARIFIGRGITTHLEARFLRFPYWVRPTRPRFNLPIHRNRYNPDKLGFVRAIWRASYSAAGLVLWNPLAGTVRSGRASICLFLAIAAIQITVASFARFGASRSRVRAGAVGFVRAICVGFDSSWPAPAPAPTREGRPRWPR